ncbi:Sigma-adaptin 3A [Tieghemiomyces parasiticus]|uniref:AP complex subunit sigma n=1 Tax=Tieghemiomyces parasiticus TaxID=78921 RepID=A0A9W8DWP6_9FUNG|nr:Sigma-adaptin 3A [Tieghemiomyces parasiticus]
MIKSVLIFNTQGKPRLTKFYQQIDVEVEQAILKEIHSLVARRPAQACNFLEGSKLLGGADTRIIYRNYATLYFVFVVDSSESELGILDLIQVSSLDGNLPPVVYGLGYQRPHRCFENVCELDLVCRYDPNFIFHFEEVNYILSEVITGGMVLETNINEIIQAIRDSNRLMKVNSANGGADDRSRWV